MQFCSLIIVLRPLSKKPTQSLILTPNYCSFILLRSSWDFTILFKNIKAYCGMHFFLFHDRVRAIEHETETKFHLDTQPYNANHEKCVRV